jgi:hypothetical protein
MADKIVSPGVFTKENDLSFLQQGVADIGAAFIGPFKEGPLVPTIVNSQSEFQELFGTVDDTYYTPLAVQSYLRESGVATICRVGGIGGYTEQNPLLIQVSGSTGTKVAGILFNTDTDAIGFTNSEASNSFNGNLTISGSELGYSGSISLNPENTNDIESVFGNSPFGSKGAYVYGFFKNHGVTLDGSASSSVSWSFTETRQDGTFTVFDNATTLATLTANGTGNAQVSESRYVTASLSPVSFPSSGSVTMSLFVNGGTTLSQTVYTNTTISASFLVASGSAYGITGSIEFNSGSAGDATLAWSFSVSGGPSGAGMGIKVNDVTVVSRNSTESGTYPVNVGDVINVVVSCNGCSGGNATANAYCTGIITDAACTPGSGSVTLTSSTYTVVSGDIGNTLTLASFAQCSGGCI